MSSPSVVWPSLDAYQNAVLHPKRNLKDARLHSMQVELRAYGVSKLPFGRSGNFGSVYKFSNQHQAYALKVFLSAEADRELRYRLIDQHLESRPASTNLVSFGYEDQGIMVQGRWYPSLTMDWVAGHPLDRYLSETLKRHGQVDNRQLCQAWVELVLSLMHRSVAHGDLQHGNILVLPNESLKLVDYDGMFVPAMRRSGLAAAEMGRAAYQHPKRNARYFDERLDHFSALLILLCLASITRERWKRFHTDDNCLIVRESDLIRPDQSALFAELLRSPEAPLKKLALLLKSAAGGSLDAIPVFDRVVADGTIRQLLAHRPIPPPDKTIQTIPRSDHTINPPEPPHDSKVIQPVNVQPQVAASKKGALGIVGIILTAILVAVYNSNQCGSGVLPRNDQPRETPVESTPTPEPTAQPTSQPTVTETPPAIQGTYIQNVWLDNVVSNGTNYLVVHCSFQVAQSDSNQVWVLAFFWLSDNSPMRAQMSGYSTTQGQASVWTCGGPAACLLDVQYAPATRWTDLPLHIPYAALSSGSGHFATIEIRDTATGRILATARTQSF